MFLSKVLVKTFSFGRGATDLKLQVKSGSKGMAVECECDCHIHVQHDKYGKYKATYLSKMKGLFKPYVGWSIGGYEKVRLSRLSIMSIHVRHVSRWSENPNC